MLALINIPDEINILYKKSKLLSENIIDNIIDYNEITVDSGTNLFDYSNEFDYIFIKEGVYKTFFDGKLIRFYSDNDLVCIKTEFKNLSIVGEFGTVIIPLKKSDILNNSENIELIADIIDIENKINLFLISSFMTKDIQVQPELKLFSKGDIIIKEGSSPDIIYEMISGEAIVSKSGVNIGKISSGEIFGEISFLNECDRTATVIAESRCEVITIKREIFENLIHEKPQFLFSISRTLAKRIIDLNNKIIS